MDFLESVRQPPGMPNLQTNANVSGEFVMRVGIPHTSGKLAFHAFKEGYAAMVSAGAFWDPGRENSASLRLQISRSWTLHSTAQVLPP